MKSQNMSLFDLFDRQRRYLVPLFQRPYVWGKEDQWAPLWQDIRERAEKVHEQKQSGIDYIGSHFLGAIVLNQIKVFGRQVNTVEIIDGQQRLTTLQIMLAAFRDLIPATEERHLADDLQRLTKNTGSVETEDERFKVWPTNADRKDFEALMNAGSREALEDQYPIQRRKYVSKPDPRPRLIEAYFFFSDCIRDFCFPRGSSAESTKPSSEDDPPFSSDRAFDLLDALRRHIQLVVIDLDKEDDPQVIFETLNARGVALLPSDLIRNFVFHRAERQKEKVETLYKNLWSDYDNRCTEEGKDKLFWKQEEGRGRRRRTRLDLFMYHYVQYQYGKNYGIDHLFKTFRDWWESSDRNVENELQELRKHSDVFAKLFVPEGESRIDIFAKRLRALDTSTIYPVLLMLLVGGRDRIPEGDLDGIAADLESFLIRRMICDLGNKNNNRLFFSMLQKLRKAESISRIFVQKILLNPEGPANRWPNDKEFSRAWLENPVYQKMKTSRCVVILQAIEEAMQNANQGMEQSFFVERVLPQSWKESARWLAPTEIDFQKYPDETAIERRNRLLHSMGNLTLLTQKLNASVSNGAYENKRHEIAKQSALRLNIHFQDTFVWNESEIQKRGQLLFQHARRLWPYPQVAQ